MWNNTSVQGLGFVGLFVLFSIPSITTAQTLYDPLTYRYSQDHRDPFQPFLQSSVHYRIVPESSRTAIQRYALNQYTLTGIILGKDRVRALVQDPDGIEHIIEIGSNIGKNWGKVELIEEKGVIIVEEFHDSDGQLLIKRYDLRL